MERISKMMFSNMKQHNTHLQRTTRDTKRAALLSVRLVYWFGSEFNDISNQGFADHEVMKPSLLLDLVDFLILVPLSDFMFYFPSKTSVSWCVLQIKSFASLAKPAWRLVNVTMLALLM